MIRRVKRYHPANHSTVWWVAAWFDPIARLYLLHGESDYKTCWQLDSLVLVFSVLTRTVSQEEEKNWAGGSCFLNHWHLQRDENWFHNFYSFVEYVFSLCLLRKEICCLFWHIFPQPACFLVLHHRSSFCIGTRGARACIPSLRHATA